MISSRKSACIYLIMRGPNLRMKITGRCSRKTVLVCHGRNRQSAGTRKKPRPALQRFSAARTVNYCQQDEALIECYREVCISPDKRRWLHYFRHSLSMNDKSPMCSSIRGKVIAIAFRLMRLSSQSCVFCGANFIENLLQELVGELGSNEGKTCVNPGCAGRDSRPYKGLKRL